MLTRVNEHKLMLPAGAIVETFMFDVVKYKDFEIMTFEYPMRNVLVVGPTGDDIEFPTFEDAVATINAFA